MTPEQYIAIAQNPQLSSLVIQGWAQNRNITFSGFTLVGDKLVTSQSNARNLFSRNTVYLPIWYASIHYLKPLLDQSTIYKEESIRTRVATQVGMHNYVLMTGSLKLITPKDVFILMSILSTHKYPLAGVWRQDMGISVMKPAMAKLFWGVE